MKWTAEADLVVGVTVGSGKRKVGFGVGIKRRKVVKRIGVDLGEELLRRFCLFVLKDSDVLSWDWSSLTTKTVHVDREKAMKRSNVVNLLLQMMPSSLHAPSASPDHWTFLEEVDAPQWADLVKEAALMGTQGDDPWFSRRHSHHETSLARAESLPFAGKASPVGKPEQPPKRKGSISKLIKPSLKANAVKACLGGMHRASNGGSKEGRRSSRPRVSGQPRPRTPKKVHVQHTGLRKKAPTAAVAGSDPRLSVCEPFSDGGTWKKSDEAKIDSLRRIDPALNAQGGQKIVPAGVDGAIPTSGPFFNGYESPHPSLRLYRLPSPPDGPKTNSPKSSPSDMIFSSDASPTTSNSSQDSRFPTGPSLAALVRRRKILTDDESGKDRPKLQPGASPEPPSASPSARYTNFKANAPSLDISSFKVLDHDLSNGGGADTITFSPDWKRGSSPDWKRGSSPRLKRRSLGPPLRVKQVEKVGSSSVKKKGSSRLIDRQDAGIPGKLIGAQATHPILEKLRKSWGSALRVKQRQDAEVAVGDATRDDNCQNSVVADQKVGTVLYFNNNEPVRGKKLDNVQVQSELARRGQSGGAAIQSSEEQVLVKDTTIRERQLMCQRAVIGIQVLDSPTRIGLDVPASGIVSKPKSMGATVSKTSAQPAAKVGLGKIQPNHQKVKSEVNSKFKKQYAHPETGISKSLSMRANKENMHSEMRVKAQASPAASERKRKTQTVGPRSIMRTSARQLGPTPGVSPAASPVHVIRSSQAARMTSQTGTNPQARNVVTNKRDLGCRTTRTSGQVATDSFGQQKSESLDRKLNNSAVLQPSGSSSLKLTSPNSEKISITFVKEVTTNAGPKGCKIGVQVVDESIAITAEDRKSRVPPKYEPRIHTVKAIREWESKSGRRYYDLQPGERQKVNQQITAASKTVTKRSTA